ncbi:hypothetical protein SAMN04487934_1154 [Eubacterium ruminantium]|nr:hypothetical protein SAMN04487934_1154 [Eubacterium ruminantium]
MKEIDNDNKLEGDLFNLDIPDIEHVEEAADTLDENELEALKDDLKVKDTKYKLKLSTDLAPESNGTVINGEFENGPKLQVDFKKVHSKVRRTYLNDEYTFNYAVEPNVDLNEQFKKIANDNALNETMSIDMDMNMKDNPDEVGFQNTEKELISDELNFDKLESDLKKYFGTRIISRKAVFYDDQLIDKMAEYFATNDKILDEAENPDKIFFNPEDYKKDLDKRKNEYKNNPFFVNYLKVEVTPGFIQRNKFSQVIKNYTQMLMDAGDDLNGEPQPFFNTNRKSGRISYNHFIEACQQKLSYLNGTRQQIQDDRFKISEYMNAVDLIVTQTLLSSAAKKTFLKNCMTEDGKHIDFAKFTTQVNAMRKEIRNDPKFMKQLEKHVPRGQFYNSYRTAIKEEISANKRDMEQRSSKQKTDKKYKDFSEHFLSNNTYHIDDAKIESIQTTYAELVEYNKGKKPSDYMKKLLTAYETIIKEYGMNSGFVSGKTINELNKRAVKYYDKRSGIFKGPNSDKGKGRLNTVEKLLTTTNSLMKTVNSDMSKAYKKAEAEQKKTQSKTQSKAHTK